MDVMIDIETLGNRPGAPVISIGAVAFDPHAVKVPIPPEFKRSWVWKNEVMSNPNSHAENFLYTRVPLKRWNDEFGKVDGDTLEFWFKQPDAARLALVGTEPTTHEFTGDFQHFVSDSVWSMLNRLSRFLSDHNVQHVWSKPATFDLPMIEEACEIFGHSRPWDHRATRCAKTMYKQFYIDEKSPCYRVDPVHHALSDAISQTMALLDALQAFHDLAILADAREP